MSIGFGLKQAKHGSAVTMAKAQQQQQNVQCECECDSIRSCHVYCLLY